MRDRRVDLEIISLEPAPEPAIDARVGANRRRLGRIGWRSAGVAVVLAGVVATAVFVVDRPSKPATEPAPTPATIDARPAVRTVDVVVAVGDKIVSRPVRSDNAVGPLGVIRLAAPDTPRSEVLAVSATTVLAQGVDVSGDGREGTWAFPTAGGGGPVFLGSSTGFVASLDTRRVWLTEAKNVWEVAIETGATVDGPYPLDGRVVASVGGGLLLQRVSQVVWWIPGSPGETRPVGAGTALSGSDDYILWQGLDGRVNITDPNIGRTTNTALRFDPGATTGLGRLSPDRVRVAAVVGTKLIIADSTYGGHTQTLQIRPVEDFAWLDDNTLIVTVGAHRLLAVDAKSRTTIDEPDFAFDTHGLALLDHTAQPHLP